jgi:hypothetical protein
LLVTSGTGDGVANGGFLARCGHGPEISLDGGICVYHSRSDIDNFCPSDINNFWIIDVRPNGDGIFIISTAYASFCLMSSLVESRLLCCDTEYKKIDAKSILATVYLTSKDSQTQAACPDEGKRDVIVIVTTSGIKVFRLDDMLNSSWNDGQEPLTPLHSITLNVLLASALGNYVAIVHQVSGVYKLCLYSPSVDGMYLVGSNVGLDYEPTCVSVLRLPVYALHGVERADIAIALGFQDGSLMLALLRHDALIIANRRKIPLAQPIESIAFLHSPPADVRPPSRTAGFPPALVNPQGEQETERFGLLVCSYRTGTIATLPARFHPWGQTAFVWSEDSYIFPVSTEPVKLTLDINANSSVFFLCNGRLHQLEWLGRTFDNVRIERVAVRDDSPLRRLAARAGIQHETLWDAKIEAICAVPVSHKLIAKRELVVVTSSSMRICSISFERGCQRPRTVLFFNSHPQGIHYSDSDDVVVLSLMQTQLNHNSQQRYLTPQLCALYLQDGIRNLFRISEDVSSDVKVGERITCLTTWNWAASSIGAVGNSHKYPSISTSQPERPKRLMIIVAFTHHGEDGTEQATIRWFSLKKVNDNAKIPRILSYKSGRREKAPVLAMCQFGEWTLVYGSGNFLKTMVYDTEKRTFERGDTVQLGNASAVYLTAGKYIYVTTSDRSIQVYNVVHNKIKLISSGFEAQKGVSHLAMKDKMVLATRDSSLTILNLDEDTGKLGDKRSSIRINLPTSIARVVKVKIRALYSPQDVPGLTERDLYGTAMDGGIWNFAFLTHTAWRVLFFLERMIETNKSFTMLPNAQQGRLTMDPDNPRQPDPTMYHISGDLLERLVKRVDAFQELENMLLSLAETPEIKDDLERSFLAMLDEESKKGSKVARRLERIAVLVNVQEAIVEWVRKVLDVYV